MYHQLLNPIEIVGIKVRTEADADLLLGVPGLCTHVGEDGDVFHVSELFVDCWFVREDIKTGGSELKVSVGDKEFIDKIGQSAPMGKLDSRRPR